ncbi:MAG: AIM24 family protein [Acidimicrobiales bacterium]
MTDVGQRVECQWCHADNPTDARSCDRCGAPLDVRNLVSDAGWRQAPRLRDLTEIQFMASTAQIDGDMVPVAEMSLDPNDSVFFEHHVMLWKDDSVPMSVMSTPGGAQRLLGDMPFVLSVAHGPGRLAFSRDAAGELVVLPVDPGDQMELRGHAMLVASANLSYSYSKVAGVKTMLMAGTWMYLDRFEAGNDSGVVVVHGYGNVFQRSLGEGDVIHVEPGGFLYKDASVRMEIVNVDIDAEEGSSKASQGLSAAKDIAGRGFRGLKAARALMKDGLAGAAGQILGGGGSSPLAGVMSSNRSVTLMALSGPGRVGIQSMYAYKATD